MWPVANIMIITASPEEAARPMRVSEPCVFWLTMAVAVPAKISIRVPMNSAPTCSFGINISYYMNTKHEMENVNSFWLLLCHRKLSAHNMHTFLASETGGGGSEQETGGNLPSSIAHSSTLKHLQLLSRDFLP